jgi:transcriptional regulator with XRE-family HTH domain
MRWEELCARIEAENPVPPEIIAEVDPPNILALNVVRLRSARGLTQAQLAEALGVAQPRIAEIERGDANPRLITLSKLAFALGVSLPELLVDNLTTPDDVDDSEAVAEVSVTESRKRKAV